MTHLLGAHMSVAGGLERAVVAAKNVGFTTVQVFTKNNSQWNAKPLVQAQISAFRHSLAETGVANPVAHNSYLINLASPDEALWNRSIDAMVVELERCEALEISGLVSHPGAHVGSGEEVGLARIAAGIDEIHRRTAGFRTRILLETTAGQGSCLGHRFEHIGWLIGAVSEPERLGVCVDTCHIFAAGYALETPEQYNETIECLDRAIGLGRVALWHLNDSVKGLGSRVDRHAAIGSGEIGTRAFGHLLRDPRFASVPMVLETPKGIKDGLDLDALNLATLRRLEAEVDAPTPIAAEAPASAPPARRRTRKAPGNA